MLGKKFVSEFNTFKYVAEKSKKILLFAHSHPDGDTIGAVLSLKEHFKKRGKEVSIACFDPFPKYLSSMLSGSSFEFPNQVDIKSYDAIIACDSVERGFQRIMDQISSNQVVVLIDHHPDITIQGDVNIIDSNYSSVCEIVYDFFSQEKIKITKDMATFLLLGILGDTGMFQNSNTTARIMEITSDLMKKGASVSKIADTTFSNKKISTLKLWGKAFGKAKINEKSGMIVTAITKKDMEECGATSEDIAQVASILNTVPGTRFALILSEREGGVVKGSLRSEDYKGADVSLIAQKLGGGGHKLASGFEVKGFVEETPTGWRIKKAT